MHDAEDAMPDPEDLTADLDPGDLAGPFEDEFAAEEDADLGLHPDLAVFPAPDGLPFESDERFFDDDDDLTGG